MEKNVSLSTRQNSPIGMRSFVKNILSAVMKPVELLAAYYSACLEREVNVKQTLLLVNAQAAFFMTAFPAECPLMLRIVCVAWMLHSLKLCKDNL